MQIYLKKKQNMTEIYIKLEKFPRGHDKKNYNNK